jgi:hypothetical protein
MAGADKNNTTVGVLKSFAGRNVLILFGSVEELGLLKICRGVMKSVPPRGSGWADSEFVTADTTLKQCNRLNATKPTRYREVVLTSSPIRNVIVNC